MRKFSLTIAAAFSCALALGQSFPNAGFENWRSGTSGTSPVVNVHAPLQWFGFDSLIIADQELFDPLAFGGHVPTSLHGQLFQETTIVNSGTSSAKLITVRQDTVGRVPGLMANASVGVNILALIATMDIAGATTFSGGTPVTQRITNVSAWVRYTPGIDSATHTWGGLDTGALNVQAFGHKSGGRDTLVGTAFLKILPSTSFTQVTAHVNYWDSVNYQVDTIRIVFSSSAVQKSCDSSTLYVDDVSMTGVSQPDYTSVKESGKVSDIKVYPNPASDLLNFVDAGSGTSVVITNVSGQVVATKTLGGNQAVKVSELPEGLYIYTIRNSNDEVIQTGKVTIKK